MPDPLDIPTIQTTETEAVFHLGLTMAGAISAGAYTAGVFDCLIAALELWRQKGGQANVPKHKVVISVMSGASAGSIVGAVGVAAAADSKTGLQHAQVPQVGQVSYTLPMLYQAWVSLPAFLSETQQALLGLDDLMAKAPLVSVLNSAALAGIVEQCFANYQKTAELKTYFSQSLHLFFTHSNLRGVGYSVPFTTGGQLKTGYAMTNHADRTHFVVTDLGSADVTSAWADPDPAILMQLQWLQTEKITAKAILDPRQDYKAGPWTKFAGAALASGSFPAVLAARYVSVNTLGHYVARQWPLQFPDPYRAKYNFRLMPQLSSQVISPAKLTELFTEKNTAILMADPAAAVTLPYIAVDGGMFNNEPFELTRFSLMKNPPKPNPRDEESAALVDRAVVMIDPFPPQHAQDAKEAIDGAPNEPFADTLLLKVIMALVPAFLNQSRCKFDELVAAYDEQVYSRYLIAPVRKNAAEQDEKYALASGLVGGFGGFLAEAFRAHDYQLGRLNCYRFLKHHFSLPADYQVVRKGYAQCGGEGFYTDLTEKELQIIPIFSDFPEPRQPDWPLAGPTELNVLVDAAAKRADLLIPALTKELDLNWRQKLAATLAWKFWGKKKLKTALYKLLETDLKKRKQWRSSSSG
ncbi:hypothetical protein [Rheinheimera soli]|uniref:Patatin-like phospholipase n=1 Tax=Rheinheimera soli TaxID=443616 RepID=A0ABU1VZF1_9GAMM|nr:hypothetical protein [Rheinheimera soli]MDR7121067.1 hypothetical protein [Rheinheimera soli]